MNLQHSLAFGTARATGLFATLALAAATHVAAAPDAQAGKVLFDKTCANCHSIEAGINKVGPSLFDVVDRPVAAVPGYDYSKTMRAIALRWKTWDEKHLDMYLKSPREVLHGVKMFFAVPDPQDRSNVIAYLQTLK